MTEPVKGNPYAAPALSACPPCFAYLSTSKTEQSGMMQVQGAG